MINLSVNINKVALLRNTRDLGIPSVLRAAETAVRAGAHGITVHPRPDQRHIRPSDVYGLAEFIGTQPGIEFNIEGNPHQDFLDIVRNVQPHQCTLVPDSPEQATSDHGWNLSEDATRLKPIVAELHRLGCRVSLFMDPDLEQIRRAPETGADRIELYTQPYAAAYEAGAVEPMFQQYAHAAAAAQEAGLGRECRSRPEPSQSCKVLPDSRYRRSLHRSRGDCGCARHGPIQGGPRLSGYPQKRLTSSNLQAAALAAAAERSSAQSGCDLSR